MPNIGVIISVICDTEEKYENKEYKGVSVMLFLSLLLVDTLTICLLSYFLIVGLSASKLMLVLTHLLLMHKPKVT